MQNDDSELEPEWLELDTQVKTGECGALDTLPRGFGSATERLFREHWKTRRTQAKGRVIGVLSPGNRVFYFVEHEDLAVAAYSHSELVSL